MQLPPSKPLKAGLSSQPSLLKESPGMACTSLGQCNIGATCPSKPVALRLRKSLSGEEGGPSLLPPPQMPNRPPPKDEAKKTHTPPPSQEGGGKASFPKEQSHTDAGVAEQRLTDSFSTLPRVSGFKRRRSSLLSWLALTRRLWRAGSRGGAVTPQAAPADSSQGPPEPHVQKHKAFPRRGCPEAGLVCDPPSPSLPALPPRSERVLWPLSIH